MKLELNYKEKFANNLTERYKLMGGIKYTFKFDNGYGASVIKHWASRGNLLDKWELAVLKFDANGDDCLCYSTHITDDVIGYLTDDEVNDLLEEISKLEDRSND